MHTIYWAQSAPHDNREHLSQAEQERAAGYSHREAREGFVTGRSLLRNLLTSLDPSVSPPAWPITIADGGQPKLTGPHQRWCFSISHTTGLVVVALSVEGVALGVDVESTDRTVRAERLLRRFFSPAEVEAHDTLPVAMRRKRFFELWTTNEAYVKALGTGLATPLSSFSVVFGSRIDAPPSTEVSFPTLQASLADRSDWSLMHGELIHRDRIYHAAIAVSPAGGVVLRSL